MPFDPTNFLYSLAQAIATAASLAFPPAINASHKSGIWVGTANEDFASEPYAVLMDYGGPIPDLVAEPKISVQVVTKGTNKDAVRSRAWAVYGAFIDDSGELRTSWIIDGIKKDRSDDGHWMILGVAPLGRPGFVGGPDDSGRENCVFSIDITFFKKD